MKKRQHYVWREYLREWSKNEQIFFLQNDTVFHSNIMNIAQEKFFYQLQRITYHDITWIRKIFIEDQPKLLQENNEGWLKLYSFVFDLENIVKQMGRNSSTIDEAINVQIKTLGEEVNTHIENIGIPLLMQLRQEKTDFARNDNEIMHFYYFISEQYFRTKRMKINFTDFHTDVFDDFNSCWNVCSHILATTLGYNLYKERKKYGLFLLHNESGIPFITGDQPIINTFGNQKNKRKLDKDEFELFYPIKPNLALLVSDNMKNKSTKIKLSSDDVESYNDKIFDASYDQIYANSEDVLKKAGKSKL
jgi:hypothetical protein